MSTAADRDKQIVLSRKVNGINDVSDVCAAHDGTRLFVDHPIVDFAGFIIIFIARLDQPSAKVSFEIGNRIFVEHILKQQICFQLDFRPVRRDMIRGPLGECPRRRM